MQSTPVIIGVGEVVDRPNDLQLSKEPLLLMADALHRADEDAGGGWLERLESLDVVNSMTWGYNHLPTQLCQFLGIHPARAEYGVIGGSTPVKYIHDAAIQIAIGKLDVAAICGAEAAHSLARAQKTKMALPWTPEGPKPEAPRREGILHPVAIRNGLTKPVVVYPLYEYATRSAWGQSFEDGQAESAQLWSQFSSVAADNPYAWLRQRVEPSKISSPSQDNRLVAGPYTKLMVANPTVNQGAAILLTSFGRAKACGVPEDRMIFLWGGSAASEPADIVARDQYHHSCAMDAVLTAAKELAHDRQAELDFVEFYSCFPCVPKMARRVLEWPANKIPTVTGGLTFFGGPYNNYMSHGTAAMTRRLRESRGSVGLLYGQGGFVTKHHALLVATRPPNSSLSTNYNVQEAADRRRGPAPVVDTEFVGAAKVETYTIIYDRQGAPDYAVVFTRTDTGSRVVGRVDSKDGDTMAFLMKSEPNVIGTTGRILSAKDDLKRWSI